MAKLGFTLEETGAAVRITEKTYVSDFPELMKEWDWEKNDKRGLDPTSLTKGSRKKPNWICSVCGFPWDTTSIYDRTRGYGCPACSGHAVYPGHNDLASQYKEIANEWDYDLNDDTPDMISWGSSKSRHWICPKTHKYDAKVKDRTTRQRGCPYCAGQRVLKGFNDLASQDPELAKEWHPTMNVKQADNILVTSETRVYWLCENGHCWLASVKNRHVHNTGCPYCANKKAWPGYNDLATTFPHLAAEWDYGRNAIRVSMITACSAKLAWWICPKGHHYQTKVCIRSAGTGHGCPYCGGTRVLKGFNDLASQHPEIADEWDMDRNEKKPDEVYCKSIEKYWFKCGECGEPFKQRVDQRTLRGFGCPNCKRKSNGEKLMAKAAQTVGIKNYQEQRPIKTGIESRTQFFDGFIPDTPFGKSVAIEFQGRQHFEYVAFFHNNLPYDIERDLRKYEAAKNRGIIMVYIADEGADISNAHYRCVQPKKSKLFETLCDIFRSIKEGNWETFSQYAA